MTAEGLAVGANSMNINSLSLSSLGIIIIMLRLVCMPPRGGISWNAAMSGSKSTMAVALGVVPRRAISLVALPQHDCGD
jgi:hypothetical protein